MRKKRLMSKCNGLLLFAMSLALISMAACDDSGTRSSDKVKSDVQKTKIKYPIVDTDQVLCYDNTSSIPAPKKGEAFYGQDAQHDGNLMDYALSSDKLTVYDNITGLTWTKTPDLNRDGIIDINDKLSFEDALTYSDSLNKENHGGYNDWRLPNMKQLYSLMNFSGTDSAGPNSTVEGRPFIDTDYFDFAYGNPSDGERAIDSQYWSSNAYTGIVFGGLKAAFGLNLADGRIKGYPSGAHTNFVLFMRGSTDYGINDFKDNSDGTITDNATGLMWVKNDSGLGMNWHDALAWAQTQNANNYLGYSDWRLPNAKEMHSLLDYSRSPNATSSAAMDPLFNITKIMNEGQEDDYPYFWTSTTHANTDEEGEKAVYISFGRAMGWMGGQWCDLHGAGAQRSDYKGGELSEVAAYDEGGYHFKGMGGDGGMDSEEGGMTGPPGGRGSGEGRMTGPTGGRGSEEGGMTGPPGGMGSEEDGMRGSQGGRGMMTPEDAIRMQNYVRLVRDAN